MKKNYLSAIALAIGAVVQAREISKNEFGQEIISSSPNYPQRVVNTENSVLWEQAVSEADTKYSITSSHFELAGWGMYAADDFKFETESTINSILFYGSQSEQDGAEYINSVDLYFYEDEDNSPAGNPAEEGSEILKLEIDYNSDFVTVEPGVDSFLGNKVYTIDLEGYFGEGITLDSGPYWLSIVFNLNLEENDFNIRWLWSDSEADNMNPPKLISPNPDGDLFIPEWTPISQIGFPMTSMAFTLFGEDGQLGTSDLDHAALSVYPNPAVEVLYVKGVDAIENVAVYSVTGQLQNTLFKNDEVNVSGLASGMYIVHIKTADGTVEKKFIKK